MPRYLHPADYADFEEAFQRLRAQPNPTLAEVFLMIALERALEGRTKTRLHRILAVEAPIRFTAMKHNLEDPTSEPSPNRARTTRKVR